MNQKIKSNNSNIAGNGVNGNNNSLDIKQGVVGNNRLENKIDDYKELYSIYDGKHCFFTVISLILSVFSTTVSLFILCNLFPRSGNLQLDYLGVILGILSLMATVLIGWQIWNTISLDQKINDKISSFARMFESSKKEIDNSIEKQKNYIDKTIIKCVDIAIKSYSIQNNIDIFVDTSIKDGLAKYKDGLDSLASAMRDAATLENPQISAYIINQFIRIVHVTNDCDFIGREPNKLFIDYITIIRDNLNKNIKIIENANMRDLLMDKDPNYRRIEDCMLKISRIYKCI